MSIKSIVAAVLGVFALLVLLIFNPVRFIDEGERGVVTQWGAVTGEVLQPGMHFINPISKDVQKMVVRTWKTGIENLVAFSADKQDVFVDVGVNYNLDPNKVGEIYSQFGHKYDDKVVYPAIDQIVKQEFNKRKSDSIVQDRDELRDEIRIALQEQLAPSHITVTEVYLEDIDFDQKYRDAILNAQLEEQKAVEQINVTKQAEEKNKQAKLQADAEAYKTLKEVEALQIGGDAYVRKIEAESELARAKAFETFASKWNGQAPDRWIIGGSVADALANKFLEQ